MTIARATSPEAGGAFSSTAAIELRTIRIAPGNPSEGQQGYKELILSIQDRQMDLVRGLREYPGAFVVEERFLRDPAAGGQLRIYFLLKTPGETAEVAAGRVEEFTRHFLRLLIIHCENYEFELVEDADELANLLTPFVARDVVEIARREIVIDLDSAQREESRHLGFSNDLVKVAPRITVAADSAVYYVAPFALPMENLERLCNALLVQDHPCYVGVCLASCALGADDESGLRDRIACCEKYAQLPMRDSEELALLKPFLHQQAELLLRRCTEDYTQLRDACFRTKIRVVSPDPIPHDLLAVCGASFTEHAGHPFAPFEEKEHDDFAGGYVWLRPQTEPQRQAALQDAAELGTSPWASGLATPAQAHWPNLFSVNQAGAVFRLPVPLHTEFPGVETVLFSLKPAPLLLPEEGVTLGNHRRLGSNRTVRCARDDRRRHIYVIGQTGTGKSTLFENMVLQDIAAGSGACLIDPHGDLFERILASIPPERAKDVVIIDPSDTTRPVGINLLDASTPLERDYCANYLFEVFDKLYDLKATGGPIFEMYLRNCLQIIMTQPPPFKPTVLDIPRLFQDEKFRERMIKETTDPYAGRFFGSEAMAADRDLSWKNIAPYITSKFSRFVYNDVIRRIIGQVRSTIDFRDIMDTGKILLVNLSKGRLGGVLCDFLGMTIVGKLFLASLSRTEVKDKSTLRDFYLYVDEFQNLATGSFYEILSEARKYRLSLTLANQYLDQLPPQIIGAILGNVGTLVSFRVGSKDAELISGEFRSVVTPADIMGLPNWSTYLRLLCDGEVSAPFSMETCPPLKMPARANDAALRKFSRQKYGTDHEEVEREIRKRWEIG